MSVENVHAFVLGGHGDTMVPLPRLSTVAGIPITQLLSKERIDAICKRTADGGAEITKLVGTSAWYAPGESAAEMVEAILKDKKKILPCSAYLEGEYGVKGQFLGVPVKLGAKGIEQIIEIKSGGRRAGGAEQVGRCRERAGRRYKDVGVFRPESLVSDGLRRCSTVGVGSPYSTMPAHPALRGVPVSWLETIPVDLVTSSSRSGSPSRTLRRARASASPRLVRRDEERLVERRRHVLGVGVADFPQRAHIGGHTLRQRG